MKITITFTLLMCTLLLGCSNEMIAKLGGTPQAETSKYFKTAAAGISINKNTLAAKPYITVSIINELPEPAYLSVIFEIPDGEETVDYQVSDLDRENKFIDIKGSTAEGWKLSAYKTIVKVYSGLNRTTEIDILSQPYRNFIDPKRLSKSLENN